MRKRNIWLLLLLTAYLAVAILFAAWLPAWQAPDEPAHYNYIHELVITGQFPVMRMGDYDEAYLERLTTERFPPQLSIASVRYEGHQPPLYYLLGTLPFSLSRGSLLAVRLLSVGLGALFVLLIYAIVRLIFPNRAVWALGAAGFTAFLPMHVAMAAAVNNDALAEVLLAAILWLSIRYVKLGLLGPHPPSRMDALALGAVAGLALITKVSAYVGIPVALAAPLIVWFECQRTEGVKRLPFSALALIALPALLMALPWYVRNAQVYGNLDILGRHWHDAVVVGQLRTSELIAQAGLLAALERFLVWSHDSFWGVFGWMGAWLDSRVYSVLLGFSLATLAGSAVAARDMRARMVAPQPVARFQRWALALLGLAALGTLGIYLTYNLIFVQPQGRYLFPALPAISLAVAVGWWMVTQRASAARRAAFWLLAALVMAIAWGVTHEGINRWSVLIFAGAAAALLAWSWLNARLPRWLAAAAFALPFALLPLLNLYALFAVIVPQLAR